MNVFISVNYIGYEIIAYRTAFFINGLRSVREVFRKYRVVRVNKIHRAYAV